MKLINPQHLSKKQYRELIESLGGKYGWIERLKMGGTGVGGLQIIPADQADLQLTYKNASESVRLSIEQLKRGILIGFNNTKEIKLLAFRDPKVEWKILGKKVIKGSNRVVTKIQLRIDEQSLILYTSGWNNEEVFRYLDRLEKAFPSI